jgi:hypothetical protein
VLQKIFWPHYPAREAGASEYVLKETLLDVGRILGNGRD